MFSTFSWTQPAAHAVIFHLKLSEQIGTKANPTPEVVEPILNGATSINTEKGRCWFVDLTFSGCTFQKQWQHDGTHHDNCFRVCFILQSCFYHHEVFLFISAWCLSIKKKIFCLKDYTLQWSYIYFVGHCICCSVCQALFWIICSHLFFLELV